MDDETEDEDEEDGKKYANLNARVHSLFFHSFPIVCL